MNPENHDDALRRLEIFENPRILEIGVRPNGDGTFSYYVMRDFLHRRGDDNILLEGGPYQNRLTAIEVLRIQFESLRLSNHLALAVPYPVARFGDPAHSPLNPARILTREIVDWIMEELEEYGLACTSVCPLQAAA